MTIRRALVLNSGRIEQHQAADVVEGDYRPAIGRKNAIMNGNFDYWQRGSSISDATGALYSVDRWFNHRDGTVGTYSYDRQVFAVGQTDVPESPRFFFRISTTSPSQQQAGTFNYVGQRIEWVRTFEGRQVTISFYAKADQALTITTGFEQEFGSGGTPSSAVSTATANHSVTTTWQKFTHTLTLPSISGKTLGLFDNDALKLKFGLPVNPAGSFAIDLAQVQVELGPDATRFERRTLNDEFKLCQRYYQKTYSYDTAPGTTTSEGQVMFRIEGLPSATHVSRLNWHFQTPMRANPTVTWYSPGTGTAGKIRITGTDQNAATVPGTTGHNRAAVEGQSAVTTDMDAEVHGTADAEL